MKRLPIVLLLITGCDLPTFAQQYFPAMHSSKDQKQVIEAVLRHELAHKKGTVFVRVLGGDPSQELVKGLRDLPVRILPASRAREDRSTSGFDVPAVITYKDEVSGKEGPLFDIRRLEWRSERYVRMIGGYNMTGGWDGKPQDAINIITLDNHKEWRVR